MSNDNDTQYKNKQIMIGPRCKNTKKYTSRTSGTPKTNKQIMIGPSCKTKSKKTTRITNNSDYNHIQANPDRAVMQQQKNHNKQHTSPTTISSKTHHQIKIGPRCHNKQSHPSHITNNNDTQNAQANHDPAEMPQKEKRSTQNTNDNHTQTKANHDRAVMHNKKNCKYKPLEQEHHSDTENQDRAEIPNIQNGVKCAMK
jgi:hypothetical protein